MSKGIYSSIVGQHLETISSTSQMTRKEIACIKQMIQEAILKRETDFGKLLDLAIEVNRIVDGATESLLLIRDSSEKAAQLVGPHNKERPDIEDLI